MIRLSQIKIMLTGAVGMFFLILICFLLVPFSWLGVNDGTVSDEDVLYAAYNRLVSDVKRNYVTGFQTYSDIAENLLDSYMTDHYNGAYRSYEADGRLYDYLKEHEESGYTKEDVEGRYYTSDTSEVEYVYNAVNYKGEAEDAVAAYYLARASVLDEYYNTELMENEELSFLAYSFGPFTENFKAGVSIAVAEQLFSGGNVEYGTPDDSKMYVSEFPHTFTYRQNEAYPSLEGFTDYNGDPVTDLSAVTRESVEWDGEISVDMSVRANEEFMQEKYDSAVNYLMEKEGLTEAEATAKIDSEIDDEINYITSIMDGHYHKSGSAGEGVAHMFNNGDYTIIGRTGESDGVSWTNIQSEIEAVGGYMYGYYIDIGGITFRVYPGGQCTDFVRWRIMKHYGEYFATRGNGKEVAELLVADNPGKFVLTTNVEDITAGTVYSEPAAINKPGHVGYVEAVEGDTVWISDGNIIFGNDSNCIRLNWERSKADLQGYIFAVPAKEYLMERGLIKDE